MNSPDPASLQNLNDIALPATVGWWPLATGWYFLVGLLLITLAWLSYRSLQRWINNRYRRAALSGDDWYGFLNSQVKKPAFNDPAISLLDHLAYSTGDLRSVDTQATTDLFEAIRHWLNHHEPVNQPPGSKGA